MDEIESQDVAPDAEEAELEDTVPESDTSEEAATKEPKAEKPSETLEQKKARLERQLEQLNKKLKPAEEAPSKKDGLDDTQLDYLDLKGITAQEDIDIIEAVMEKTGKSLRDTLKDPYVTFQLNEAKKDREVKDATPSSTKRHGGQSDNLARAISKFESSGELPDDFSLRTQVVNAIAEKGNKNKPTWHS